MKMLEKILVGTDFTSAAHDALVTARAVAKVFKSRLILMHVIPVAPADPPVLQSVEAAVRQRLDELAAETAADGVTVETTVIAHGSPFDQILQVADAEDVNVIMVGSEQKRPDDPFRLGVTPERLIRKSDKPVWVVKPGSRPLPGKIVCAVDFSEPSRRALTNAVHLARQFGAELTIVHVLDTPLAGFGGTSSPAAEDLARRQQQGQAELDQFLAGFDRTGVRSAARLLAGSPAFEILKTVREVGADLLVLGSVGRTGLPRILLGSVAEKVVRELPCSVVTVKAEHAIRVEVDLKLEDLEACCRQGEMLLEKGFSAEALRHFEACLAKDPLYIPAWEGAAEAHERLGHSHRAQQSRDKVRALRERLEYKRIQFAVRTQHPLWRKKR